MEDLQTLIRQTVIKLIEHGINPEDNQLELKQEWPNLKEANSTLKNINISKFLRSLTALANTYGPGNKYLIYGISEKGDLLNAPLKSSGVTDPAHLYDLIARSVDKPITYEFKEILVKQGNKQIALSIFIIPPSYTKPHVLENYFTEKSHIKNYIPVKKGTKTVEAGKHDLDLMYYDRGNVIPEYALNILWFNKSIAGGENMGSYMIPITLIFENNGRRPLMFKTCALHLIDTYNGKNFILKLGKFINKETTQFGNHFGQQSIVITPNFAISTYCEFHISPSAINSSNFEIGDYKPFVQVEDVVGNIFKSETLK